MRLILHALLVLFFTHGSLIAQWQSINSPPGGYIRDMIQVGTTIYAASGGGVLYSQDQGSSWSWVNTGLSSYDTKCLVEIQDTVYVGTDYGLFRWSTTEDKIFFMPNCAILSSSTTNTFICAVLLYIYAKLKVRK